MRSNQTPEQLMMDELIRESRETLEKSKQSTEQSLQTLEKTKQLGKDILTELNEQGNQLDATQGDVDDVLHHQEVAKRQVRTISSILWDLFYRIFPSPKRPNHYTSGDKPSSTAHIHSELQDDVIGQNITDKKNKSLNDAIEDDLDEIYDAVSELSDIAEDIGDEINNHNKKLDTLGETTGDALDNNYDLKDRVRHAMPG